MSTLATLPVSNFVPTSVILSAAAAQAQATNTMLVLGSSTVIDVQTRIRGYAGLAAVALDFGTGAPEYAAAVVWFAQTSNTLFLGRWAQTASAGQLFGAPLTPAQQLLANFTAITDGAFKVAIDAGEVTNHTAINLSGAVNLNGVAALITTALAGGATCVWNASIGRFEFTSATTGVASLVTFLTAGTAGEGIVDISGLLGGTAAQSGSFSVPGIAAETALAAVSIFDARFGQKFYALAIMGAADADYLAIVPAVQAMNNKHFFGITSPEPGIVTPGDTTNVAYLLSQQALTKGAIQYSTTSAVAAVSLIALYLNVNYTGTNTVINGMWKQEPGIQAENLDLTQLGALNANNANAFAALDDGEDIVLTGTTFSTGQFIDTVIGSDILGILVQNAILNALRTIPTKIAQTDAGMHILVAAATGVLIQFVNAGLLAPGVWSFPGFGALVQGQNLEDGYYVYAAPVATQSPADRDARIAVPIQIAVKLAGAINTVPVLITVNP